MPSRSPSDVPASPITPDDKQILLRLARRTLKSLLAGGGAVDRESGSAALDEPRATFVTLRRRDTGDLRGCRGEIRAVRPLADSVAHMAVSSATDDPRFPPVAAGELDDLHIEISALTPMRPITPEEIEIGRHGLMIVLGGFSGLFLPQVPVEQKWDLPAYLKWLCRKAGLPDNAWTARDATLYGFEAEVWGEEEE